MKLILNDGTKVEGTLEELLDFLKEYKKVEKDIKPTYPIVTTNPAIWPNPVANPCEGCPINERIKKGEMVVDDSCYWCGKNPFKVTCRDTLTKPQDINISLTTTGTGATKLSDGTTVKLTMDTTNDPNKQPFDEYASGLPVREAMTGSDNFSIAKKQYNKKFKKEPYTADEANALLKKYGMLNEDGTVVDEYRGNIKETDK